MLVSKIKMKLKYQLREIIPPSLQVPFKYYFNALSNTLEPEVHLLKLLIKKNDLVIDIGGNRGVYSFALNQLGAKVEIFEPNPDCSDVLSSWANSKKRVSVNQVALSDSNGEGELNVPLGNDGTIHDSSGSLENKQFKSSLVKKIRKSRLDDYRFTEIKFIKIDVEGHEYKVLSGAEKSINTSKPALLVEIEQRHCTRPIKEIFTMISSWNYEGYFLKEKCLRPINTFDLENDQPQNLFEDKRYINNFLFLHSDLINKGLYNDLLKTLLLK